MKRDAMVGDLIVLVLAGWLFISPWLFGFTDLTAVSWVAWIGAVAVGAVALAALVSVTRWLESLNLVFGLALVVAPWLLNIVDKPKPATALFQTGLIVVTVAVLELLVMPKSAQAATA